MANEELKIISEIGDQRSKSDQYKAYLDRAVSDGNDQNCKLFIDHGAFVSVFRTYWQSAVVHLLRYN